ncbi:superoxide dismutase, Ni [archaeon]|nr:superoxide dismutase, Ni [archaeon]
MKAKLQMIGIALIILFTGGQAWAHCQLPCGIYDDPMRINMIREDITTIEKAMNAITSLQKEKDINYNQLVRWIGDKEIHADKIQETVSKYFMTQRVKPEDENYNQKIKLLHEMLIQAMLTKQTTDLSHVKALRDLVNEFESLYFKGQDNKKDGSRAQGKS